MKSYSVNKNYVHFQKLPYLEKLKTREKSCKNQQSCNKIPAIQATNCSTKLYNALGMEVVFLLEKQYRFQESRQVPLTLICIPHPPQNTSPTTQNPPLGYGDLIILETSVFLCQLAMRSLNKIVSFPAERSWLYYSKYPENVYGMQISRQRNCFCFCFCSPKLRKQDFYLSYHNLDQTSQS